MIGSEADRWASAMHALRPDWRYDSLRTFANNHLAARPYRDACVAGAWVATDPRTKTPHLLTTDGPWWAASQPDAPDQPTDSTITTRCEHGLEGIKCADCYPPPGARTGIPMPAYVREELRKARQETEQ